MYQLTHPPRTTLVRRARTIGLSALVLLASARPLLAQGFDSTELKVGISNSLAVIMMFGFVLGIFSVIYGLDFIATVPPSVRLTVQTFGREMGPAVFAWIFAAHHVAAGTMAFGTGVSRDMLGTYAPAFLLAGALCVVAAASFALVRRPRPAIA